MKDKQPDDLLFTTRNGTLCTGDNFRFRHLNPLLELLGLENSQITPQVFRQYFFAKGVNSGIDAALLSKAMGHTTINTSMRYYFVDIEEEDKPLEKKVIDKPNKSEVDNYSKVIEFNKKRLLREKRIREKFDPIGSFLSDVVTQ